MHETTLLKIALVCSLCGLVGLFLISSSIDIKDYSPLLDNNGDTVKLSGKIQDVSIRDGVAFVTLNYTNPADVIFFTKDDVRLNEDDYVEIIGKVDEFKNKKEIIAQNIKVIR